MARKRNAAQTATPATVINTKNSATRLPIKEGHYKTHGSFFGKVDLRIISNQATQKSDGEKVETEIVKTQRV